jgi:chemotaxis signal transduction protein
VATTGMSPTVGGAPRVGVCAFWFAGRCFGLAVSTVGEVVTLDAITRVPAARPGIRGLFNLRGEPVVVIDLAEILELGAADHAAGKVGLVLRIGELVALIQVDRVEAVIPPTRGELTPSGEGEHRAVIGLLDDRASGGRIVTVLDSELLRERLHALRYLTDADD